MANLLNYLAVFIGTAITFLCTISIVCTEPEIFPKGTGKYVALTYILIGYIIGFLLIRRSVNNLINSKQD